MRVKSSEGIREPAVVEVEDVDIPDAADLDVTHPEVIKRGALHLEVRRDLIGESRKPPHLARSYWSLPASLGPGLVSRVDPAQAPTGADQLSGPIGTPGARQIAFGVSSGFPGLEQGVHYLPGPFDLLTAGKHAVAARDQ